MITDELDIGIWIGPDLGIFNSSNNFGENKLKRNLHPIQIEDVKKSPKAAFDLKSNILIKEC